MSNITKLSTIPQSASGIDALLSSARECIDQEVRGFYEKASVPGVTEAAALLQAALETLHVLRLSGVRDIQIHGDNDDLHPSWLSDTMAVVPNGTVSLGDEAMRFGLVIKISKQHKKFHCLAIDIVPVKRAAEATFELGRLVQARGHDIFHFTEAEILADPWCCAARISDWSDALQYEG